MQHLNKEQMEAVRHRDGPILVLAGPGSGKTAVLTEHIRFLTTEAAVDPASVLALTFSKKAANEMRHRFLKQNRLHSTSVTFGTFHSIFYNVLRQYNKDNPPEIATLQEQIRFLQEIMRKHGEKTVDAAEAMRILQDIAKYKNTGKYPDPSPEETERFLKIYDPYCRMMIENGKLDYEDMILQCIELFERSPQILKTMQERFLHILIDEFQDCNMAQYRLLMLLSARHHNLFAVGDDDQSIYGFRGADASILQRFLTDHPDHTKIHLLRNYRCAKSVIKSADSLIRHNTERIEKPEQLPSVNRGMGKTVLLFAKDAYSEAVTVHEQIRELLSEGIRPSEIAILYRTEQCADYLEEYLTGRAVPFSRHRKNTFYEMLPVKQVLAYLYLALGEYRLEHFYQILNHPDRGLSRDRFGEGEISAASVSGYCPDDPLGRKKAEELFSDLERLHDLLPFAAIWYIARKIGLKRDYELYLAKNRGRDLPDADTLFADLADRAKAFTSVRAFLDHVEAVELGRKSEEVSENRDSSMTEALIMQTIHASKGLEYEAVFVIGLQEGILPGKRAVTLSEIEEERRLLYVAMTRARTRLFLLARGSTERSKRYSPFVEEIRL